MSLISWYEWHDNKVPAYLASKTYSEAHGCSSPWREVSSTHEICINDLEEEVERMLIKFADDIEPPGIANAVLNGNNIQDDFDRLEYGLK